MRVYMFIYYCLLGITFMRGGAVAILVILTCQKTGVEYPLLSPSPYILSLGWIHIVDQASARTGGQFRLSRNPCWHAGRKW